MVSSALELVKPPSTKEPLSKVPDDGIIIANGHADSLVEIMDELIPMDRNGGEKFIDTRSLKEIIGFVEPKHLNTHAEFAVLYKRVKDTQGLLRCLDAEFANLFACLHPVVFSLLASGNHQPILKVVCDVTERLTRLVMVWGELYPQLAQMIRVQHVLGTAVRFETELHRKGALENLQREVQSLEDNTLQFNKFVIDGLISLAKNRSETFKIYPTLAMQMLDTVFASS